MPRFKYRTKIPLVGAKKKSVSGEPLSVRKRIYENFRWMTNRGMVLVKPQRRLGAPWIDSFVSQRKNVRLCLDCCNRYRGWAQKCGYRFAREARGDCMGCSKQLIAVYSYVHAEEWETFWDR